MSPGRLGEPLTITGIRTHSVCLCLGGALSTGRELYQHRELLWLELSVNISGRSQTGHGECAPLVGWSSETVQAQRQWLEQCTLPVIIDDIEQLDKALPALREQPTLRSGIELALLDALARDRGITLAALLSDWRGRDAQPSVAVQYTLGSTGLEQTLSEVTRARAAGFDTIKLKVGATALDEDIERISLIRQRFPDLRLRLDANAAWSVDEALQALDQMPVDLIEQPVSRAQLHTLMQRRQHPMPQIAADESCVGPEDARQLIASGGADTLVLKPAAVGGLLPAHQLLDQARTSGIEIILSNLMESSIGRSGVAALASAWPEHPGPHGLATGHWFSSDLSEDADLIENGRLFVRQSPGIGFIPRAPG